MKISKVFLPLTLLISTILIISGCACRGCANPTVRRANATIVSSPFRNMTVTNFYRRSPGCYIACDAHDANGNTITQGIVRINGLYIGKVCQAQGHYYENISNQPYFKNLCSKYIPGCANNSCTVDGFTGGWLGIQ